MELDDDPIGAFEIDTRAQDATRQNAAGEWLLVLLPAGPRDSLVAGVIRQFRQRFGTEEALDLLVDQLGEFVGADLSTTFESAAQSVCRRVGTVEVETAMDEIVRHHAAKKGVTRSVCRDNGGIAFVLP